MLDEDRDAFFAEPWEISTSRFDRLTVRRRCGQRRRVAGVLLRGSPVAPAREGMAPASRNSGHRRTNAVGVLDAFGPDEDDLLFNHPLQDEARALACKQRRGNGRRVPPESSKTLGICPGICPLLREDAGFMVEAAQDSDAFRLASEAQFEERRCRNALRTRLDIDAFFRTRSNDFDGLRQNIGALRVRLLEESIRKDVTRGAQKGGERVGRCEQRSSDFASGAANSAARISRLGDPKFPSAQSDEVRCRTSQLARLAWIDRSIEVAEQKEGEGGVE